MRFFGASLPQRALDPAFSDDTPYRVPVDPSDLTWDLSMPGLTTQYKSFYFNFSDGSAGYMQFA